MNITTATAACSAATIETGATVSGLPNEIGVGCASLFGSVPDSFYQSLMEGMPDRLKEMRSEEYLKQQAKECIRLSEIKKAMKETVEARKKSLEQIAAAAKAKAARYRKQSAPTLTFGEDAVLRYVELEPRSDEEKLRAKAILLLDAREAGGSDSQKSWC